MKKPQKVIKAESNEGTYKLFLNDKSVDVIPQWAIDRMSERLSRVVSLHFAQHPDEYERFLRSRVVAEKKNENVK